MILKIFEELLGVDQQFLLGQRYSSHLTERTYYHSQIDVWTVCNG